MTQIKDNATKTIALKLSIPIFNDSAIISIAEDGFPRYFCKKY